MTRRSMRRRTAMAGLLLLLAIWTGLDAGASEEVGVGRISKASEQQRGEEGGGRRLRRSGTGRGEGQGEEVELVAVSDKYNF
jgi:hypothetical protein